MNNILFTQVKGANAQQHILQNVHFSQNSNSLIYQWLLAHE